MGGSGGFDAPALACGASVGRGHGRTRGVVGRYFRSVTIAPLANLRVTPRVATAGWLSGLGVRQRMNDSEILDKYSVLSRRPSSRLSVAQGTSSLSLASAAPAGPRHSRARAGPGRRLRPFRPSLYCRNRFSISMASPDQPRDTTSLMVRAVPRRLAPDRFPCRSPTFFSAGRRSCALSRLAFSGGPHFCFRVAGPIRSLPPKSP